jgi:hypothetical protein
LDIEKYQGDDIEDTDKPAFINNSEYLQMARELEYEGIYGTADSILRALVLANGNIGHAKYIRLKMNQNPNYQPAPESNQRLI